MTDILISSVERDGKRLELYESTDENAEVYIDGAQGVATDGRIVKINCYTRIYDEGPADRERRRLAVRLVMTQKTFHSMRQFFTSVADELEAAVKREEAAGRKPKSAESESSDGE